MATLNPAARRRRIERLSNVRELVFGIQDGILTTAGVLCGLSGAVSNRSQVILAALASTAAGALSMGAGAYLGTRAEAEVLRGELSRAEKETAAEPYIIQQNLLDALNREGLSRDASYRVVQLLSSSPQVLKETAQEKVLGLSSNAAGSPVVDGIVMGLAFLVGALVPLLPYMISAAASSGLILAVTTTALALFAVGCFTGWMGEASLWVSGAHFLAVAVGAAVAGYLIGLGIARIGGLSTVPIA